MKRVLGYFTVASLTVAMAVVVALTTGHMLVQTAWADDVYGRIRGTVTDSAGASMTGVEVVVTNTNTGIAKTTRTGASGEYEFLNLPAPGTYSIVVQQQGFKTYRANVIHLGLNQTLVLDISLELGSVSETVLVEADKPQVEQASMQLTNTISSTTITQLPLNGRNYIFLQQGTAEQLPGKWQRLQRSATELAFGATESRRHRRSQARDQHDQPGIWTQLRCDLECRHQIGNQ